MTGLLASVASVEEAQIVLDVADIVDLKNPADGPLGALSKPLVENIVRFIDGRKPVSATIGNLPMVPDLLQDAVFAMSNTGVNIVKVGFFGQQRLSECVKSLAALTNRCKIVVVMFADQRPDFSLLSALTQSSFYGVMLDTENKSAGSIRHYLNERVLQSFVEQARAENLFSGLAGSLELIDIPLLTKMAPDFLGFRGLLCRDYDRQSTLELSKINIVARLLRENNNTLVLN